MSTKIGVLGEAQLLSLALQTCMLAPTSKAAKFRLFFVVQGNAGGGTIVDIVVNGIVIGRISAMTASYYVFTAQAVRTSRI